MGFLKVSAQQCNAQGHVVQQVPRGEIYVNIDLIGGIKGNSVLIKGGTILHIGGQYYTGFMTVQGIEIPT
jgi:hypothetical protein